VPPTGDALATGTAGGDKPSGTGGTPAGDPGTRLPPLAGDPEPTPRPNDPGQTSTQPANLGQIGDEPAAQPPVATLDPSRPETSWPLAQPQRPDGPQPNGKPLVRVGDDLMLGDLAEMTRPKIVDGVLPGSRAFAQLRNGNYFIGSIKTAGTETVTLSLEKGEVTIAMHELTRLTELGSADYEELQRATSGFIRLTNNNRLVGGILSRIADDHVVLEFRSNRVMLPKSLVGQVVQGEGDAAVRLNVTSEENDWVKKLAERQLGSGTAPTDGDTKSVGPKTPAPRPQR
jgi:hypothetical protein